MLTQPQSTRLAQYYPQCTHPLMQCQEAQVEQLGNGLAYCLLMHHYFPVLVPLKKICLMPRRQSDNINNLRFLI